MNNSTLFGLVLYNVTCKKAMCNKLPRGYTQRFSVPSSKTNLMAELMPKLSAILLMEEILHHLGCIKPVVNKGIFYHIKW